MNSIAKTPEGGLMCAVMRQAREDIIRPIKNLDVETSRGRIKIYRKLQREAFSWFFSDRNGYIYDFGNICRLLGYKKSMVRRKLIIRIFEDIEDRQDFISLIYRFYYDARHYMTTTEQNLFVKLLRGNYKV